MRFVIGSLGVSEHMDVGVEKNHQLSPKGSTIAQRSASTSGSLLQSTLIFNVGHGICYVEGEIQYYKILASVYVYIYIINYMPIMIDPYPNMSFGG